MEDLIFPVKPVAADFKYDIKIPALPAASYLADGLDYLYSFDISAV
jgi:hypothetical protein